MKRFPGRLAGYKIRLPLLIFAALATFTQLATAQNDPENPANEHGASSSHTVNINVPKLSAIDPPGTVTINVDAGELNENVPYDENTDLEVTTNNPNPRAIYASVSKDPSAANDIRLLVKEDGDSNWRVIYGASGSDSAPSKEIIDGPDDNGIDGVHEKSYPIDIGVEVGPDFDPTGEFAFEITYTLVEI